MLNNSEHARRFPTHDEVIDGHNAGISTGSNRAAFDRLALPAAEVAELLGISVRHLWTLNSSGRLPRPIRLGRSVRWSADEVRAWLAAGAPPRDEWESMRNES